MKQSASHWKLRVSDESATLCGQKINQIPEISGESFVCKMFFYDCDIKYMQLQSHQQPNRQGGVHNHDHLRRIPAVKDRQEQMWNDLT